MNPVTVGELMSYLDKFSVDAIVVCASDSEGNSFSAVYNIPTALTLKQISDRLIDTDQKDLKGKKLVCIN